MKFLKPEDFLPKVNKIYSNLSFKLAKAIPFGLIDHIGSSAIQGALSKGDLDVLVRVSKTEFNKALKVIQELGFIEKTGTLRTESLCMLITEQYNWDVAIQLVEKGSEFEMFLKFRDVLNEDPVLVEIYNDLKLSSVGLSPDEYRLKKSKFIKDVLAK